MCCIGIGVTPPLARAILFQAMPRIDWSTWCAIMVLMAVVAFVVQYHRPYVWPWAVLAYAVLFVASLVWAILARRRRSGSCK